MTDPPVRGTAGTPHVLEAPWTAAPATIIGALETDAAIGLTPGQAADRLASVGPNELLERKGVPPWRLFVGQFTNTMIVVLVIAAAVTAFIGDIKDTAVILAIVLLNGIIGFVQEYRAERALAALREMTSPSARVVRDGQVQVIAASLLVPGDIVRLEAGDIVPADLRLIESHSLRVNEASLTGESQPVGKIADALAAVSGSMVAEQRNMAFKGTAVTYGRATGVAVRTGMATALGRIAELLQERPAGTTPLQEKLAGLGRGLAAASLVICGLVFVAGLARGEDVTLMFLTAVSLAVAAIPEALPAVVTISLALGAQRMARRRSLIRKLPAVETLGSVNVICTDKTGTLTENRMLVERVWTPTGEFTVTGQGYEPAGVIEGADANAHLASLARVAALCNDAILHGPARRGDPWRITGDPTEGALLALAGKLGCAREDLEAGLPRVAEVAFDSSRRRMTTIHRDGDGIWVAVKGALEALRAIGDEADSRTWERAAEAAERYAADGYRVLALADRHLPAVPDPPDTAERSVALLGLVAMADPPRSESAASVAAAAGAGITSVMITGDQQGTADAVARRVGILAGDRRSVTGAELEAMDDRTFGREVADIAVYARTNPEQKLRIVEAWKSRGATVAMTGDGVNDAPALKRADIGIAMGITGTEVSKEAADMVLADDDFSTIVAAVEEGRRIYDNIRRFVRYTLTSNSGEIWAMALAPFAGLPIPLLPIHILWINLVTDGLPGLALSVEPAEPDTMHRSPRPTDESIFGRGLWQHALWLGLLMGGVALLLQSVAIARGWHWQTMVFSAIALLQLGNALAVRSEHASFFRLGWRTNLPLTLTVVLTLLIQLAIIYLPPLQAIFETQALSAAELTVLLLASTAVFVAAEIDKWRIRRTTRPRTGALVGSGAA